MSPISRERRIMSFATEAADLLGAIAGDSGSQKTRQTRAWRRLVAKFPESSWTFNRVHDLFTKDPRARVSAQEIEQLRDAARIHEEITLQRSEYDDLLARIERCERALAVSDAQFHRPTLDAYRSAVRGARGDRRAVDQD